MAYTKEQIHDIVLKQREFFASGKTLDIKFRKEQLKKLRQAIIDNQNQLIDALHLDLGRCEAEAYFCDIGDVIMEINEYLKGVKKWNRPERHFSGLACFPSMTTKVYKMPYGVSLIRVWIPRTNAAADAPESFTPCEVTSRRCVSS